MVFTTTGAIHLATQSQGKMTRVPSAILLVPSGRYILNSKEIALLELFLQALNRLHSTLICGTELLLEGNVRYFKILTANSSFACCSAMMKFWLNTFSNKPSARFRSSYFCSETALWLTTYPLSIYCLRTEVAHFLKAVA